MIAGERVQYVAVGTVDAIVDLTSLPTDAVHFDPETGRAVVYLPRPVIGEPVLDMEMSHVMNRDRGLLNRVGGLFSDNPTGEQDLILTAQAKMAEAANHSELIDTAQAQIEALFVPMIEQLGATEVEVRYYDGEAPPACRDGERCG